MRIAGLIIVAAFVSACGKTDARADGAAGAPDAVAVLAAQGTRAIAPARPLPPGVIILQRNVITDPGVVGSGPAFYVMLPQGWTGRGGVEPYNKPCSDPFGVNWSALSADGSMSVAIFPTDVWQWSTFGMQSECKSAGYTNVRDYLAAKAGEMFPGARILDYRQRADYVKAGQERADIHNRAAAATGFTGSKAWADGGEVLFAYTQNGVDMRGVIGASAVFYGGSTESPMGGEPLRHLTGATLGTFGAVAPAGRLDFTLIEAVRKSVTPDPRWLEAYFELQSKLGKIRADATEQRAQMMIAGGAEATRQNIATFRAMASASVQNSRDSIEAQTRRPSNTGGGREMFPGAAAGDRMQRESIEAIRGVETYHDPIAGGNVQLDAMYDHAWRINSNDAYILTNDPNFNPGQYGIEATQMGAVQ